MEEAAVGLHAPEPGGQGVLGDAGGAAEAWRSAKGEGWGKGDGIKGGLSPSSSLLSLAPYDHSSCNTMTTSGVGQAMSYSHTLTIISSPP